MATGLAFVTAKRYDDSTNQERNAFYLASLQEDGYIYFNDDVMWRCTYSGDYVQLFYYNKQIWINTTALKIESIKKFDAEQLMRIQTGGTSTAPWIPPVTPGSYGQGVEAAVLWALDIAADDSHGYDMNNRTGNPDYDCSSLVSSAFAQAGFNVYAYDNTVMMYTDFPNAGFTWYDDWWIHNSAYLQRGDILLNITDHVELYIGNGESVAANHGEVDEYGNYLFYNCRAGDQDGTEISKHAWFDWGYDGILRWEHGDSVSV